MFKPVADHPLIRHEELCEIRRIWLHEKHEFDDALPRIYREVTGRDFVDPECPTNRYFKKREWDILERTCCDAFPEEKLLANLCSSLLDIESQYSLMASRRGVNAEIEKTVRKCFFSDKDDAVEFYKQHHTTYDETSQEEVADE